MIDLNILIFKSTLQWRWKNKELNNPHNPHPLGNLKSWQKGIKSLQVYALFIIMFTSNSVNFFYFSVHYQSNRTVAFVRCCGEERTNTGMLQCDAIWCSEISWWQLLFSRLITKHVTWNVIFAVKNLKHNFDLFFQPV